MSGPKVVRIVTREEILATCYGQLARLDAALDEWIRVGQRNECVDDSEVSAAKARREKLADLIGKDAFLAFQKEAPLEIAFLASDLQVRLAKAAEVVAAARASARR